MNKRVQTNRIVQTIVADYDILSTAYHESAHIVISLINCFKVCIAKINSPKSGEIEYDRPDPYLEKSRRIQKKIVKKEIEVKFAGFIGESILYENLHLTKSVPRSIKNGAFYDFKESSRLIRDFSISAPGKKTFSYKRNVKKKIKKKLLTYWRDVVLIANLLLKKNNLTYKSIKNCLIKFSSKKTFWKRIFLFLDKR
ncbi:MAG: hypothetical protein LC122_12775 [Chitinophagales bacterium]|nr:hypothetical protein [Chitinophagales bacterium]